VYYLPPPPVVMPPVVAQKAEQPASNPGATLRTTGVVTAAVGAAAVAFGVFSNLKANGIADDLKKTDGYSTSKVSDRDTFETLGWVGYGLGGTCIVAGAVLYYLGVRAAANAPAGLALVPTVAPGATGLVLKGAF
jgi:hypothetical protein